MPRDMVATCVKQIPMAQPRSFPARAVLQEPAGVGSYVGNGRAAIGDKGRLLRHGIPYPIRSDSLAEKESTC